MEDLRNLVSLYGPYAGAVSHAFSDKRANQLVRSNLNPYNKMPLKRKFKRKGTFKRRFPTFRRSTFGRRPHNGYVKNYNRLAFKGKNKITPRALYKHIETHRFHAQHGPQTLTNAATVGSHDQYVYFPMGPMQAYFFSDNANHTFRGNSIWLLGIKLKLACTLASGTTLSTVDGGRINISVFKTQMFGVYKNDVAGVGTLNAALFPTGDPQNGFFKTDLTAATTTGVDAENDEMAFFDIDYTNTVAAIGAPAYTTDVQFFKTPPNPNGPTCLFNKEYEINNYGSGFGGKEIDIWLPLNQTFKFKDEGSFVPLDQANAISSSAVGPPNFGVHGDYVFVIRYFNWAAVRSGGTIVPLNIDYDCVVYYKNP